MIDPQSGKRRTLTAATGWHPGATLCAVGKLLTQHTVLPPRLETTSCKLAQVLRYIIGSSWPMQSVEGWLARWKTKLSHVQLQAIEVIYPRRQN